MSGLVFVGLGLGGVGGLSLEGVECLKSADKVYLEVYTSPVGSGLEKQVEEVAGSKVVVVSREFVEDGRQIVEEAKTGRVALVIYGDPMVATTHMDLRVRAVQERVDTRVIHSASILSAIPGETGLHVYSFGKPVTMTRGGATLHVTVYNTVFENLLRRLHTLILLEYDYASGFFLEPTTAISQLIETESELKRNLFGDDTFLLVASRIGISDQSVKGGRVSSLRRMDFGRPPHALIIPGKLHFTEVDALKTLLKIGEEEITDNPSRVQRLAEDMVKRYVKKGRVALNKARLRSGESGGGAEKKEHYSAIFENVECYLTDAERFLGEGREELAVLSVGYAEGLLDALTYLSAAKYGDIWE